MNIGPSSVSTCRVTDSTHLCLVYACATYVNFFGAKYSEFKLIYRTEVRSNHSRKHSEKWDSAETQYSLWPLSFMQSRCGRVELPILLSSQPPWCVQFDYISRRKSGGNRFILQKLWPEIKMHCFFPEYVHKYPASLRNWPKGSWGGVVSAFLLPIERMNMRFLEISYSHYSELWTVFFRCSSYLLVNKFRFVFGKKKHFDSIRFVSSSYSMLIVCILLLPRCSLSI